MPYPITGNEERSIQSLHGVKYDYDYPEGLDLTPGSDLHSKIVKEVMMRAQESRNAIERRFSAWRELDEVCSAYIRVDEKETIVKNKDERKPVSIVIPQTYATEEILLTYLTAAMLEAPIFRYEGRSPEDMLGAIMLEKVVDHQTYYTQETLRLHTALRDGIRYGIGSAAPRWIYEYGYISRPVNQPTLVDRFLGRAGRQAKVTTEEMIFEGNTLDNIDPYLFLPDPNIPIDRIQDGEFIGWINIDNLMSLLKDELHDDGLFNAKYLKHIGSRKSILCKEDLSGRYKKTGMAQFDTTGNTTNRVDTICMYIDLIPKDWKLPGGMNNKSGEYPDTWFFILGADEIVLQAKPLNLNHGKKPVVSWAPEYDGYSLAPVSKLEIVHGLQVVLNWLFNSHMTNVRKSINDMLIVDPSLINMNDLKDPEAGKLIRMRRAAWGRGIENAVKQLKVEDITRANVGDASVVIDMIRQVSGSVDSLSGQRRQTSERVTAEEVRSDRTGGLSRLEKMAKLAGLMFFQPLAVMKASHTQQLMSQETYVKTVGNWQDVLASEFGITDPRMKVTPYDILVAYDIIAKDGSVPSGHQTQAWVQMLPNIQADQEARQQLDYVKILKHIMREMGAKNVNQFDRRVAPQGPQVNPQVMPDENVQGQVQAGNLVPLEGAA